MNDENPKKPDPEETPPEPEQEPTPARPEKKPDPSKGAGRRHNVQQPPEEQRGKPDPKEHE